MFGTVSADSAIRTQARLLSADSLLASNCAAARQLSNEMNCQTRISGGST